MTELRHYPNGIVQRFARAWASIDGKSELFDSERGQQFDPDENTGTYDGYMAEALELLRRADCEVRPRLPQPRETDND